jgi:hypothetical protein
MTDGACAPTSPPPANLQRLSRLFLSRDERGALDHCAQCSEVVTFAQTVNKMGYRDPVRSSRSFFVKTGGLRWLSLMLLSPMPWARLAKVPPA